MRADVLVSACVLLVACVYGHSYTGCIYFVYDVLIVLVGWNERFFFAVSFGEFLCGTLCVVYFCVRGRQSTCGEIECSLLPYFCSRPIIHIKLAIIALVNLSATGQPGRRVLEWHWLRLCLSYFVCALFFPFIRFVYKLSVCQMLTPQQM